MTTESKMVSSDLINEEDIEWTDLSTDQRGFDRIGRRVGGYFTVEIDKPRRRWLRYWATYRILYNKNSNSVWFRVETGKIRRPKDAPYIEFSDCNIEIYERHLVDNRPSK